MHSGLGGFGASGSLLTVAVLCGLVWHRFCEFWFGIAYLGVVGQICCLGCRVCCLGLRLFWLDGFWVVLGFV